MPRPSLDIVIVNWNSGSYLRECLFSIQGASPTGFDLARVVVVDNASSDGSAEKLAFPDLPLWVVRNVRNRGFAAACNQGAVDSQSDYLLFLNPDTRLHPDSLSVPLRFMQDPINEHIGSCGIQLTDEDGVIARSCSPFPTARILCARMLGLDRLWPRLFAPPFLALDQHQRSRLVDQVMGAFMLVRRDLFDQLNGFDQRFFVYFEDLDFAFRSARLGYGCFYLTDAQAVHAGCGSSRNARAKAMVCNLVSRIQYSRKHFSLLGGIAVLLGTLFLEPIARLVRAVCRRSSDDLRETTKAYADLWRQAALVVLNRGRDRVMSLCA